jgi:hypothetical protein
VKLAGEVKAGKLITDPAAWAIAMREYDGKRVTVEIEPEKSIRSLRQNARYWSLIIPLASDYLSKTRDMPLSKEQTHYVLKSAFLGCEETELGLAPMDSRTLSTAQFAQYCEKITVWLSGHGYYLPESALVESA